MVFGWITGSWLEDRYTKLENGNYEFHTSKTSVKGWISDKLEGIRDFFGGRDRSLENASDKATKRAIKQIQSDMIEIFGYMPDVQITTDVEKIAGWFVCKARATVTQADLQKALTAEKPDEDQAKYRELPGKGQKKQAA